MANEFVELFERELLKLRDEVRKFRDEENIWHKPEGVSNSAGTLVLHLLGNLNYYIGTVIGNNGYVRDRVKEFSLIDVPRQTLVSNIESLVEVIKSVLPQLDQQKLAAEFPLETFGKQSTTYYLLYFYGHLNYHLGQVNYLRRILEN
jgi:hypothetical protein